MGWARHIDGMEDIKGRLLLGNPEVKRPFRRNRSELEIILKCISGNMILRRGLDSSGSG
jgi:hypothetical protein